jgi:hypothetical protein
MARSGPSGCNPSTAIEATATNNRVLPATPYGLCSPERLPSGSFRTGVRTLPTGTAQRTAWIGVPTPYGPCWSESLLTREIQSVSRKCCLSETPGCRMKFVQKGLPELRTRRSSRWCGLKWPQRCFGRTTDPGRARGARLRRFGTRMPEPRIIPPRYPADPDSTAYQPRLPARTTSHTTSATRRQRARGVTPTRTATTRPS